MRRCGDCRLCCKVFPLPLLDKPAGTWCRHAAAGGCAVHGPAMPDVCRQYDCFWREHETLSESWRPDRIGVVVTEAGSVSVGHHLLPVVLFQEDSAEESFQARACSAGNSPVSGGLEPSSEASRGVAARELLNHFVRRGIAVMIIHGMEARIEFDRAHWPGISPRGHRGGPALRTVAGRGGAQTARGRRRRLSAAEPRRGGSGMPESTRTAKSSTFLLVVPPSGGLRSQFPPECRTTNSFGVRLYPLR